MLYRWLRRVLAPLLWSSVPLPFLIPPTPIQCTHTHSSSWAEPQLQDEFPGRRRVCPSGRQHLSSRKGERALLGFPTLSPSSLHIHFRAGLRDGSVATGAEWRTLRIASEKWCLGFNHPGPFCGFSLLYHLQSSVMLGAHTVASTAKGRLWDREPVNNTSTAAAVA